MTTIPNKEEMLQNVKTLAESSKALSEAMPEISKRIDSLAQLMSAQENTSRGYFEALSEKLKNNTTELLNQYSQLKSQQESEISSINERLTVLKATADRLNDRVEVIFPSIQTSSDSFRRSTEAYAQSAEMIQQNIKSLVTIDAVKVLLAEIERELASKQDLQKIETDLKDGIEKLSKSQGRELWILLVSLGVGVVSIILTLVWGVYQISPPTPSNDATPSNVEGQPESPSQ